MSFLDDRMAAREEETRGGGPFGRRRPSGRRPLELRGTSVVYASETLSLAVLERFVHFTRRDMTIARSLLSIPIEIPDSVTQIRCYSRI